MSSNTISPSRAFRLTVAVVGLAACAQRRALDPVAYDENGARPIRGGQCADSENVVVTNKSSHVARVSAEKPGANGWHGDYENVATVLPGAVDTMPHYRKELVLYSWYEDQQYISGMPVPIRGLSMQCVKATD